MQIREQGQQVQLIRSTYDSTKKRCTQSVICHFKRSYDYSSAILTYYLSAEQIALLSEDEVSQVSAWLKQKSDKGLSDGMKLTIQLADRMINSITDAILSESPENYDKILSAELTDDKATKIYDAIDKLKKALRKKGFVRAKKSVQVDGGSDEPASIPGM